MELAVSNFASATRQILSQQAMKKEGIYSVKLQTKK